MHRILVAGALAAITVPILAQPVAPVARPMEDRILTRVEVDTLTRTHFARLDANRDGFLTPNEMAAAQSVRMAKRQAPHGQGAGHAMRDPNVAFDRLDANRDGTISRDEFARGRQMRMERIVIKRDGMGHGMHGGMIGPGMLGMADANKDGRVSLQEATTAALRRFDMADSNSDGRVTPEERRNGRIMMMKMR